MTSLVALAISLGGVVTLYLSWRSARRPKWPTVATGWLLLGLSVTLWTRSGGAEFGSADAAIAVAFCAWSVVAAVGRDSRHSGERRLQPRVARVIPRRTATLRVMTRAVVAAPLAGTASLLASVLLVQALPWTAVNRYVFAIVVAPIVWGLLAVWVGMTAGLWRVALLLAGVSGACSALLFIR